MANGHMCLPERLSPNLPHSSRLLPLGVRTNVMMSSAVIGAIALSSTLIPMCGIATAMPMAMEKAITR